MVIALAGSYGEDGKGELRYRALTEAMLKEQQSGAPVSRWELAKPTQANDWSGGYQTVAQLMTTDLFTVRPDDLADLAASVMNWSHIRHVPVEDDDGPACWVDFSSRSTTTVGGRTDHA